MISEKNIKTVVEGICASACAIAFLGGNPREFSEAQSDSALMIHPGFEPGKQIPAAETKDMLFAWIEARTGHSLEADFIAAMDKIATRKGGIYFLSASHGAVLKSNNSVLFVTAPKKISLIVLDGETGVPRTCRLLHRPSHGNVPGMQREWGRIWRRARKWQRQRHSIAGSEVWQAGQNRICDRQKGKAGILSSKALTSQVHLVRLRQPGAGRQAFYGHGIPQSVLINERREAKYQIV